MTLKEIGKEMLKVRNLSTIIEKKKEEFEKEFPASKYFENHSRLSFEGADGKVKDFLEKAIRESVEEALVEAITFEKVGTKNYMEGYEDAMKDLYARVKEFMK